PSGRAERMAVGRAVRRDPPPAEQQIVLDDVAAGLLQHLEQAERWLFAERALDDHAQPVTRAGLAAGQLPEQRVEPAERFLGGHQRDGSQHRIELGGGELLGLLDTERVECTYPSTEAAVGVDALGESRRRAL